MMPKAIGNITIPTPCNTLPESMNSMLVANRPVMIPAGYTAIIMSNIFFLP